MCCTGSILSMNQLLKFIILTQSKVFMYCRSKEKVHIITNKNLNYYKRKMLKANKSRHLDLVRILYLKEVLHQTYGKWYQFLK